MIRQELGQAQNQDPLFRWRTLNVLRIENLSDIVFALALGILVSSGQPVATFSDLLNYLLSIVPIAAGFAVLVGIWNAHYIYFRRYALVDGHVIFLNTILLLLILYIAYPLRFAFDSFFSFVLMLFGYEDRILALGVEFRESGIIVGYFAAGYATIYLILAGFYAHALRKHADLELTPTERVLTRRQTWLHLSFVMIGTLVACLALFTTLNGFAGAFMFLNWPAALLVEGLIRMPKLEAAPVDPVAAEAAAIEPGRIEPEPERIAPSP
jgi:hypothetical protein